MWSEDALAIAIPRAEVAYVANLTTYSDEQIASALAVLKSNNGNVLRTSRHLGIPRSTLRQWANIGPVKGKQVAPELVDKAAETLADRLDVVASLLAGRLETAAASVPIETAADLRNGAVATGIVIEKASFARGGPTSRVQQLQVTLIGAGSLAELGGSVLKALNPGAQGAHSVAPRDTPAPE